MTASSRIEHLIAVAAPYWAGEAEVVRTYFTSPKRTRETDLLWLRRQCFKDSGAPAPASTTAAACSSAC